MNKYRVYLDDIRPIPDDFDILVKTAPECIALLKTKCVSFISLDHDLSFIAYVDNSGQFTCPEGTGYDVALFIEESAFNGTLPRLGWSIHSMNPVGVKKMEAAMRNADKYWTSRGE